MEDADSDFELRGRDDRGLADWGRPDDGVGRKSDDTEGLADLGGVGVNRGDWTGGALFGLGGGDGVERYRSLVSKGGTADVRSVLDITWSLSMYINAELIFYSVLNALGFTKRKHNLINTITVCAFFLWLECFIK